MTCDPLDTSNNKERKKKLVENTEKTTTESCQTYRYPSRFYLNIVLNKIEDLQKIY